MRSKLRLGTIIAVLLALVAATLLPLSCSPSNITPQQDTEPTATVAQPTPVAPPEKKASLPPTATATQEEPVTTVPVEPEADDGSENNGATSGSSSGEDTPDLNDLIEATEDPDWKVRWDAVNALGNLKDPGGIPALVKRALYDDNPHPRWRSLWALAAIDRKGTQAIPLLLPALDSTDPVAVRNAAVALAFFSRSEAIPELLEGLKDSDEYRRWEAVFSFRNFDDPEIAEALSLLLDEAAEPAERVRREATLTLGRVGGDEVTPTLLNALQNDTDPGVRWRAALALSRFGDASLVSKLEQALSAEQDPQVREYIEEAIAKIGKP